MKYPGTIIVGTSMTLIMYLISMLLANISAWISFLATNLLTAAQKLRITLTFLSPASNVSTSSYIFIILLSIGIGINGALLMRYVTQRRTRRSAITTSATSVVGFIATLFGVGCAACGSVIIVGILGVGAGATLGALPLHGTEFSILALILVIGSSAYLVRELRSPLVCEIDPI